MRKIVLVLLILIPTLIFAQRRNRYKYEWIGGVGMTNFLGDLGGANQVGTHFIRDWEWAATRPSFTGGLRYKNSRYFAFKGALSFAMLYGNDNLTQEPIRRNRNINFRSPVIELSTQAEFFVNKEKQGSLYRIKNAKGARKLDLQGYLFAGVGFLWFNPQGQYKGSWVNLRKLSTEGQGLPGGPKKYSPFTMSFPFGVGGKYGLDNKWSIGLEIGLHYTLSDYLDDVSGVYYDNSKILQSKGTAAAYLADPQLGNIPSQSYTGQERGHSDHADAFMFAVVNANYKVMYRKRTRSKF
ncbi:MAG: hypothetical protein JNL63_12285 [Bacteroidia bacterium]|nr:hypothetical protein [Bacteroidia bacterium]